MIKVDSLSLEEAAGELLSLAGKDRRKRREDLESVEDMIAIIRNRHVFSNDICAQTIRARYVVDVGVLLDEVQRLRYELWKLRGVVVENNRRGRAEGRDGEG